MKAPAARHVVAIALSDIYGLGGFQRFACETREKLPHHRREQRAASRTANRCANVAFAGASAICGDANDALNMQMRALSKLRLA